MKYTMGTENLAHAYAGPQQHFARPDKTCPHHPIQKNAIINQRSISKMIEINYYQGNKYTYNSDWATVKCTHFPPRTKTLHSYIHKHGMGEGNILRFTKCVWGKCAV